MEHSESEMYDYEYESYDDLILKLDEINESILNSSLDSEVLDELVKINDFILNQSNDSANESFDIINRSLDSQGDYYEVVVDKLSSIETLISNSNDYLYTLNIYSAGFMAIMILYLMVKGLIGFFKPFL